MALHWALLVAICLSETMVSRCQTSNGVKIFAVNPTRGSLAGGTRLQIQGSGFSANPGEGNSVFVGNSICDPIPHHTSVSQIACKTRSMLTGSFAEWNGWTEELQVRVISHGQVSQCLAPDGCTFSYSSSWYHTPRIYDIYPVAVSEGTLVTVEGRFHATPFSEEEVSSPSQEIPLASVKVANSASEDQQPQNEPFGLSGTRCALFDPISEEPYGVSQLSGSEVDEFICMVGGPREAGRYNLSVALLGTAMIPDSAMNMGEAQAAGNTYQSDHTGANFQLQQIPRIDAVRPAAVGTLGGAEITLIGNSFTNDASLVHVTVGGAECEVTAASLYKIVCKIADAVPAAGGEVPGGRGLHMRVWRGEGDVSLSDFQSSGIEAAADMEWIETGLAEFPEDIQRENGDADGPWGQMRAFFRPPVTSEYTFVLASDDASELWIGAEAGNATRLEKVIEVANYGASRAFDRISWENGFTWNMETQVSRGMARRSGKVSLEAGEFRFLQASYNSHTGDDHLALAAVMHASPVNRKDAPAAIDEQQLLSLDVDTKLELHNVTVTGSGGSFRLRVGGKTSRALGAKASEEEVRGAVRELLSNCAGAHGEGSDGAGSAFDCVQGYGVGYRGLADTIAESGERCARWDSAEGRAALGDGFVQAAAGADKNLCRNPFYSSEGPMCLDAAGTARACAVPRCGGEAANRSAMVASFEEEEEATLVDFTAAFEPRDGVLPQIDRSEAFCGTASLFLPNSFATLRDIFLRDPAKPDDNSPFGTKDFPYICMAYKIPPSSEVGMLVLHDRANEVNRSSGSSWKTLNMTNTQVGDYPAIADWGVVADGAWHYTCLNLDLAMDSTDDPDFLPGANHLVRSVIFFAEGVPRSSYASNPFWIDEFSIAPAPRALSQTARPSLAAASAKVAWVRREEAGDAVTWQLALTSEDCTPPAAALDVVEVEGNVSAAVAQRVQEHSPRLQGAVVASLGGEAAAFSPYAEAEEVRAALAERLSALQGDAAVRRTGTCQSGYGWMVTMTHAPGDQAEMTATLQLTEGAGTVAVATVEDGGLLMGPLAADYFHAPTTELGARLVIKEAAAECAAAEGCAVAREAGLTPAVSSVAQSLTADGTYSLDIAGSGLAAEPAGAGAAEVWVAGVACAVDTAADASLQCTLAYPFIAPGSHAVEVVVPGKGRASGSIAFVYPLTVTSVTPTAVNPQAATVITVAGWGFHPAPANNSAAVFGEPCGVLSVAPDALLCQLTPAPADRRSGSTSGLVLTSGGESAEVNLTALDVSAPVIDSVTPSSGSAGGGTVITIAGSSFSASAADVSVLIAGQPCAVQSAAAAEVLCQTGAGPVGAGALLLSVSEGGEATAGFEYELSVSGVTPAAVGLGGGVELDVVGEGFEGGEARSVALEVEGTEVFVVGLFVPALALEVHELAVAGDVVGEVQRVELAEAAAWFRLLSADSLSATAVMPAEVTEEALQLQLEAMLGEGAARGIVEGAGVLAVEFRGVDGDVETLQAEACASAEAASCAAGGAAVSELVAGAAPTGSWELVSNASGVASAVALPALASVAEVQAALAALRPDAAVSVARAVQRSGVRWTVTYLGYNGPQPLLAVNSSLLEGAEASVSRATEGTVLPEGSWQLGLGGKLTEALGLNATEAEVEAAVEAAFPELRRVRVVAADGVEGRLLDREYPRQWAVRMARGGVTGLGRRRCTDPRYIDWDPSACPSHAADLFLAHNAWYWPYLLPEPADLATSENQARLQALCDAEAQSLNLDPAPRCNALLPLETLPLCGVGSGVNPPCWTERFTAATVTHLDGTQVLYERDDANAPRDSVKGYRAWKRPDLDAALAAQTLSIQATVSGIGTGMHVDRVHYSAAQTVSCNSSVHDPTSLTATVPALSEYVRRSVGNLSIADAVYTPSATWDVTAEGDANGIEATRGPIESEGVVAAAFSPSRNSSVQLPYSTAFNGEEFTLEFWFKINPSGSRMPVVTSTSTSGSGGYSVAESGAGLMEFSMWTDEGVLSTITTDTPSAGEWAHVAVQYDGREQRLVVGGMLASAKVLSGSFSVNADAALVLGGTCAECAYFDGAVAHVLWYQSAISAGAIAGHAEAANETVVAALVVELDGSPAVCGASCLVSFESSSTPVVEAVLPAAAWDGASITITGRRFLLGSALSVTVGEHPCAVQSRADAEVVCELQLSAEGTRSGTFAVAVSAPEVGTSLGDVSLVVSPLITSVTPTVGSLMGGFKVTVEGLGFPSSVSSRRLLQYAVQGAAASEDSFTLQVKDTDSQPFWGSVTVDACPQFVMTSEDKFEPVGCSEAQSAQIDFGGAKCIDAEIVGGKYVCSLQAQPVLPSSDATSFNLSISSLPGLETVACETPGACALTLSSEATPTITSLDRHAVSDGVTLTISGQALPADEPEVLIGDTPCVVFFYAAESVKCVVGSGEGGVFPVSVRYATGLAQTASSGCCLLVTYAVTVSAVQPSNGSVLGGQTVTISGSGFSSTLEHNLAFFGGRKATVLTAASDALVVKTPGDTSQATLGLDIDVYHGLLECEVVGESCDSKLLECYGGESAPLALEPASGAGAEDRWLVDGNSATVWYSQTGVASQTIALDLGSEQVVAGINVAWAGLPSGKHINVSVGTNCTNLTDVNVTAMDEALEDEWNGVSSVSFEPVSARVVELALFLDPSMERVRIKDIVVIPAASDLVQVLVAGSLSSCSAAEGCSFPSVEAPSLIDVSPSSGVAGQLLNISGTGFDTSAPDEHVIALGFGGVVCTPVEVTASWLTCTLGEATAGEYALRLLVPGVGYAAGDLAFTYELAIAAVSPTQGGLGGGLALTVDGAGFGGENGSMVTICGAVCAVTSSATSNISCIQGPVFDVSDSVSNTRFSVAVADGADDVAEDVASGVAFAVGGTLRFDKFWGETLSRKRVFLRFASVDLANGATVDSARLLLRAGDSLCERGSAFRVWAEATDNSAPLPSLPRGALGARALTTTYTDWELAEGWRWAGEGQESADISGVIQEVVSRPGWRAGSALTVVLQQLRDGSDWTRGCEVLSYESGAALAPLLRLEVAAGGDPPLATEACAVTLSAAKAVDAAGGVAEACAEGRQGTVAAAAATASSSLLAAGPDSLLRETFEKPGATLEWEAAAEWCTRQAARLCLAEEVLEASGLPFFGAQAAPAHNLSAQVPLWTAGDSAAVGGRWMDVSSPVAEYDCGAEDCPRMGDVQVLASAPAPDSTSLIPCCGYTGHPPLMAADGDLDTYWQSLPAAEATLVLDLGEHRALVAGLEIHWGVGFAGSYAVLSSDDGSAWTLQYQTSYGAGGVEVVSPPSEVTARYLALEMRSHGAGSTAGYFAVAEIKVHGCSLAPSVTTLTAPSDDGLFVANALLTPTLSSVTPSRGTTAGGSDVTVVGSFFTSDAAKLSVSLGGFPCAVQSVSESDGEQSIHCVSSASGILNGGEKYVQVSVEGVGASMPSANASFWYIDTWSARTTWGGDEPPTGCGSWVDDQGCTDSVVIPSGQVVLLDIPLPRFYLILIEGTLIFDRADLSIGASYILVRGGTLQIGTEDEPFEHQAEITLFGHPKSIELPTFGAKVLACYQCLLDLHGTPQVSWTSLSASASAGDTTIYLEDAVSWPVGSKIIIATTDFESPWSSHSEVATVSAVSGDGKQLDLEDIGVCSNYTASGQPTGCRRSSALSYGHVSESKTFDGQEVTFKAEVGLLSRNIVIKGDHDGRLCPLADTAEDGETLLSCNQFGGQVFLHSPGHESLVARVSNIEIKNAGQAFRLGRYAIHWHNIGNVRTSFQRNCSVHHSFNRGTAIHGTNFLRMESNVLYNIMGHALFVEDGVEEYNLISGNLGIKVTPSMSLLNTDQTPAVFWIVIGRNYILNNHAVASRRYGIWFRPELSATGTAMNTADVHPVNIPLLEFDGNQAHSNGKYGLRVFDVYMPDELSVFRNTFVWRNGEDGFTATVIGRVGFDGLVSVQNGKHVFVSRATNVNSWEECFVANGLFVDDPDGLPLNPSFTATSDSFSAYQAAGGPMSGGLLLPWNEDDDGGMVVTNVTFVNFVAPCIRGCAHCGRAGSPVLGDGAFETRFEGMRFVDSPERALFRHPNEAFLYDLDGTLTDTGIQETYTKGGSIKGASFVGDSVLLPNDGSCSATAMSTQGTGGVLCTGHVFRRMWYHIRNPSSWVGKALCVRMPHQDTINTCQNLQPECNCLPYLKKAWKGNVWLVAEGQRYNVQMDLQSYELADPDRWDFKVWATFQMEDFYFTQRFLQWDLVDQFGRPLYWSEVGNQGSSVWAENYFVNETACSEAVGCGQLQEITPWPHTSADLIGGYALGGVGVAGDVPIPEPGSSNGLYTIKEDADQNGVIHTLHVRGPSSGYAHRSSRVTIRECPKEGCWPPPQPPGDLPQEAFSDWSDPGTWNETTSHPANPLNKIQTVEVDGVLEYTVLEAVEWAGDIPGEFEDVWIPAWKQVRLDVDTPVLGRLVVEGLLLINASATVDLSATWIELKGGKLIIATTDENGTAVAPFDGSTTITLYGTNDRLAAVHGASPRNTPEVVLGKEGVTFGSASIGVMGELVAMGTPTVLSSVPLAQAASEGDTEIVVVGEVDWEAGSEIVLTPTDFDMHESEVVQVVSSVNLGGSTRLTLDSALQHDHYAAPAEVYGSREIEMRGRVGLLSHNIVIRGTGEGEAAPYETWNSPAAGAPAAASCGNGLCQNGEDSASCPADCTGPQYEYGASILVAGYTEDFTYCTQDYACFEGFQQIFSGKITMSNVEMRYFGQNNLRSGIEFKGVAMGGNISHVAMNRGYYHGISIEESSGVSVSNTVIFRSILPALRILEGSAGNVIADNLAVVSIFWNTHRGATQGDGLAKAKLNAMIGMFHDEGEGSVLTGNVAAGSERAGFSGAGVDCADASSFTGNEAHSSLSGFWFDFYGTAALERSCTALTDFTAWKIYEYAVYGEIQGLEQVLVTGLRAADARVGVLILMGGASSAAHQRMEQKALVQDALIVGHSDNAHCQTGFPSLWTCSFYMAWCSHLGLKHRGVVITQFLSGANMAPLIKPWFNAGAYPALYGQTELSGVTFARFGEYCSSGPRRGIRDAALSGLPAGATAADGWHPVLLSSIEQVDVASDAVAYLDPPSAGWINQADCIDMDCDGPKHALIRDEDGSLLGGSGGSILPRAEEFSEGSFFGLEYKDAVNIPDEPWWYPNVPAVMRTNRAGDLLNLTDTYLRRGFGLARKGCVLEEAWNAWRCPSEAHKSHRRLIIENMDADHEIRRVSPVALSSESGYTDLLNGCMDHGWCFSYTCLKRLMTFWAVVNMNTEYTVHFTGTNPQKMRLHLPYTPTDEKIIIKIYYQSSLRLNVFVGESHRLVEDMNMYQGVPKAVLVRDGRWAPNDGGSGYTPQLPSLDCPCLIGGVCESELLCRSPSSEHGANRFNRAEGMLEIVLSGHDIDNYIDIEGMPVVGLSLTVGVSVDKFYDIKTNFISTLADLLQIDPLNIAIIDVVAGNARRRNLLSSHNESVLSLEIEPKAAIALDETTTTVLETDGSLVVSVTRSVNVNLACSVQYDVASGAVYTAEAGVNFVAAAGVLQFESGETTKTVTVTILSEAGYATASTMAVVLSNAINASVTEDTLVVTIQNVHPPAPTTPEVDGVANASSIPVGWSFGGFSDAPAGLGELVGFELECRTEGNTDWTAVTVEGTSNSSLVSGLATYTLVECRVRAECAGGQSDWSEVGAVRSAAECGDGERHGAEECDDGDVEGADGCSAACEVEVGFACSGVSPDVCFTGCGDGDLDAGEECDDGDNADGDGCSAACREEAGWGCAPSDGGDPLSQSACSTTCGDGVRVEGLEGCDDSNTAAGDGCGSDCAVEANWECRETAELLSECQSCGNGVVEGSEVCDTGDAASAQCLSCAALLAGWTCSGEPSVCVGGPAQPAAPMLLSKSTTALEVQWSAPDGFGVAVASYNVQWTNGSGVWGLAGYSAATTDLSLEVSGLTAATSYSFRVQACHSQGCSAFSVSNTFTTSAPSATDSLNDVTGGLDDALNNPALTALVGDLNATVTPPPAEPRAPNATNEQGLRNESDIIDELSDELESASEPPASEFGVAMEDTSASTFAQSDGTFFQAIDLVRLSDNSTAHTGSSDVITVTWALQGQVTVGVDVTASSGTVAFAAGQTQVFFEISLIDNDVLVDGGSVSFTIVLTSVSGGATLLASQGISRQITVTDSETAPTVALTSSAFTETSAATLQATVEKSVSLQFAVRVHYTTSDGTATAGTDYVAVSSGSVVIPAGTASGSLPVTILERSGDFTVTITSAASECAPGSGVFACSAVVGSPSVATANITAAGGGTVCGNGIVQGDEVCDDGNQESFDGCSGTCGTTETLYSCTTSNDLTTCTLPSTPGESTAFVRSTTRVENVSDANFDGDGFRRAVGSVTGVSSSKVGIEGVARRRADGFTTVRYRLVVAVSEASAVAAALAAAHNNGALLLAIREQGLGATSVLLSWSTIVRYDSGTSEDEPESTPAAASGPYYYGAAAAAGGVFALAVAILVVRVWLSVAAKSEGTGAKPSQAKGEGKKAKAGGREEGARKKAGSLELIAEDEEAPREGGGRRAAWPEEV